MQDLCQCSPHGGFQGLGVPEQVVGGLVCVALRLPALLLLQAEG